MNYLVLAYYRFVPIDNPTLEVQRHKTFFEGRNVSGRIYISEEGINGQMSGQHEDAVAYQKWLSCDERFKDLRFNIHHHHENIFPRMTVKYRAQLVALDEKIDTRQTGTYLSPQKWKEMLENEKDVFLVDVRNQYEWQIGHFENATLPALEQFREFPAFADELKEKLDSKTKVMMYCTGGIRCELYSALLKKRGFEEVYQLEGGVINYGLQEGNAHWKGKLFVFDDRLAVSIDQKQSEPIAVCHHCQLNCDTYNNCANMDCNNLFICCNPCLDHYQGCCSFECSKAERVRPLDPKCIHKPFRKKHLLSSPEQST